MAKRAPKPIVEPTPASALHSRTRVCQICKKEFSAHSVIPAETVRNSLYETIQKFVPHWDPKGYICQKDLKKFRRSHVENVLQEEKGRISEIEKEVVKSLAEHELLARNVDTDFEEKLSIGQRIADKVASFGGSWNFIISFGAFLILWMILNAWVLSKNAYDPYPFILLNLCLSALAALQAPVIMMSQNRSEARDRARSQHDYQINLKAELEIRHINEKIDHLLQIQWQRLMEIQQIQLDLMEDIAGKSAHAAMGSKTEWHKLFEMQQVQLSLIEQLARPEMKGGHHEMSRLPGNEPA